VARSGRQTDDDRRARRHPGGLEDCREATRDGGARGVLGRHAQPAGRPLVAEGRRSRQEEVVDDRLERAGSEDVVEGGLVSAVTSTRLS
jgi:hypothetical protein